MEMTLDDLLHEIARLRTENLALQEAVKRLKAKAATARTDQENQPEKLIGRAEADELRKQRRVHTKAPKTTPHPIPYHLDSTSAPAHPRAH
jgi:hypothetical protein